VGKLAGIGANERPKLIFEDNIKINIKEIGWNGMDCVSVA
jgi:hypothetical protein